MLANRKRHPTIISRLGRQVCRHLIGWAALPCCIGAAMLASSSASAELIVTRDDVFYIPFTASDDLADQSLSLFVSGDRGASWQLYQRQTAAVGRFSFRAGVDGEFWFTVRRSSESDAIEPAHFDQPELQVVVDRQQPRLTLLGKRAPDGRIICQWTADDATLDLASLQIQTQVAEENIWSQAEIESSSIQRTGAIVTGWVELPGVGIDTIRLRAYVKDRAGNLTTVDRDFDISSLPTMEADHALTGPSSRSGESRPVPPALDPSPKSEQVNSTPEPFSIQNADSGPNVVQNSSSPQTPDDKEIYGWHAGAAQPRDDSFADDGLPAGGVPAVTNPMIANYPSTAAADVIGETSQRVSNSRRFELDYGVDAISADEIHRIEVWYTLDGGRSWRHHGDDEDGVSPYLMEVDEDGVVGVRLLIQTQSSFTIRPPESGDPADVWIRVDATQPTAQITSVRYGVGEKAGTLELHWEAHDESLMDRPILFLYGDNPNGPWRKVADPLPNTGRYDWTVDDRAPAKIYLRLEVRDKAGNLTEETLPTPINNHRVAPRGHIRNVRPASWRSPKSHDPSVQRSQTSTITHQQSAIVIR
jgi:hypothetical protein